MDVKDTIYGGCMLKRINSYSEAKGMDTVSLSRSAVYTSRFANEVYALQRVPRNEKPTLVP